MLHDSLLCENEAIDHRDLLLLNATCEVTNATTMDRSCKSISLRGDGYGGGGYYSNNNITSNQQRRRRRRRRLQNYNCDDNDNYETIQSHNYEPDESEVWRAYISQINFQNRGQWWTTGKKRAIKRWILTLIIGIAQGMIAVTCNYCSRALSSRKYQHVYDILSRPTQRIHNSSEFNNGHYYYFYNYTVFLENDSEKVSENFKMTTNVSALLEALLVLILYQVVYAGFASLMVWIEPVACGSGIPEVKCYLNGIGIPRIIRVKTLLCKVIGVTLSTAAGLPVGKEGPMVHSGAVVAAGISQGKTRLFGLVDTSFSKFSDFRNDHEKRDFVACGTAAGVCSAFGSPIGGVLFALEEASSFFTIKLIWRAFFCAMCTLATLFWVRNINSRWGQADIGKLFNLGEFKSLTGEASNFSIWELSLFVLIGVLGGLIGAVFNASNERISLWRMKKINHSKKRRLLEVMFVSILVSIVSFTMPIIWGRCTDLPTNIQDWTNQEKKLVASLVPFQCKPGRQYNEVASLYLTESDTAIKQLFHFREAGADDTSPFSSGALFLFFVPYITLAAITYGMAVPSGLFVPTLLSGAAFGRLIGHLLHKLDHTNGTFADTGTYALIGAAAVLGGMARMTISLTVILLEATGDMQYVLPLMLTLMAARFTGNVFNSGLYDIHIQLKNIPFLQPDVPAIAERHEIVAGQVMSAEVKCLRPVERAGAVYELLRSSEHGTFPIVDSVNDGILYGTASRNVLCTLLQRRAFGMPDILDYDDTQQDLGPRRLTPLVQWDTIEGTYPRYPSIEDIVMTDDDRSHWVDLRPYANTAPYTVNETSSIQRTYRLFRTLGLRFLCVVNHNNQLVGIITRKNLLPESLTTSLLRGRNAQLNDHRD